MGNITNKELQRMKALMGIKKPINESNVLSSTELIKEAPNGKFYGIVRENKKYFIKESNDGVNFDFIDGLVNKTKNQFESYEQAVRRLNLMLEDTNVLTPDIISEKKFVIKTKKKKKKAEIEDEGGFGGNETTSTEESDGFDFGDEEGSEDTSTEESDDFDFGGEEGDEDTSTEESDGFDFGDEEGSEDTSTEESDDEDLDLGDDEEDSIKLIQKMTGKLGQKLRDTPDVSSDMSKWVAKSVISALDLDQMDAEDKKDIIRAIKKKKESEGSDEEFDFMSDMADWSKLTSNERRSLINREEDDMYGPGNGELEKDEEIILDDEDNCSYCGDRDNMPHDEDESYETYPGINEPDWRSRNMSYMSKYGKSVKKQSSRIGKKVDEYDLDEYLRKVKNKLGGSDNVDIDDDKVVGEFGYVEVTPSGYVVHKEGEKFSKKFNFDELGKLHSYVRNFNEDYMDDDPYMMPQPAPARPQTRPETPVKPAKPGTDRPSPSKRPFTPPPHITPGEEPNPKAWEEELYNDELYNRERFYDQSEDEFYDNIEDYGTNQVMDYMEDGDMEMCNACEGKGREMHRIGFSRRESTCPICDGAGYVPRIEAGGGVDEPYVDDSSPMGYKSSSTLPSKVGYNVQYKEKFNFPFNMGENKKRRKSLTEDHINDKMATYDQEMAYEDIEDMARQNGMEVEFCHKDRSKDPEEQTVYLDLMKNGKAVAKVRINSVGQIEMGHMTGKVFKGEPVDSYPDFDEVLREKRIKMSPQPAPAKPQTRPETPTKPAKPGTDKPSPSRKPFTPPPHITPGEEPNPKARYRR